MCYRPLFGSLFVSKRRLVSDSVASVPQGYEKRKEGRREEREQVELTQSMKF